MLIKTDQKRSRIPAGKPSEILPCRITPAYEKKSYLDITTLIRSIQRNESNIDCFKRGVSDCDKLDCKWRSFCLEGHPY